MPTAKIQINWEKLADTLATQIKEDDAFNQFCTERFDEIEDKMREALTDEFVNTLSKEFKPRNPDDIMEFVLTLQGDLMSEFWKKFVTEYLGRKW